ncbi:phytanoyl-CoA dioxygenase family protein [Bimuria novae-zelandiae CBS 107.79]|uniref:Phytanoyl-CoA dioxygenase family protein n=1 Tax=Bimuria novae-zelandiae CBS 107.79 TaxID=1447943 RepID=A0A6A5UKX5_9PLEO|nr:phytanoyl-CoA dioxygenase family protein [Bimuria novae-zelandiae CBS 107.79]
MSLPSTPISIKPSATEIQNGALSQQNLEIATRALRRDGLVVLEDLIQHSTLDKLNKKMVEDTYELRSRKDSPFNYHKGNIQQDPLLTKEYFFEEVFTNPIVTQVTSTTLGPKSSLRFISGNTALPPTKEAPPASQPTHNDADFDHPGIPFALVINVPLIAVEEQNGSTEVWLGTHANTTIADQEGAHGDRASGRIKKHLLDERRKIRAPSQPTVSKGSVIVRELRLWHGGKPNLSDEPRVMLAFIHFAPWYRNQMTVEFAEDLKDQLTLEKTGLHVAAEYVTSEEVEKNYLNRPYGNAYDFDQVDKINDLFPDL